MDFEKPSTWALALSAGLLVAGCAALGDVGHAGHPAVYYALLALVSFAAVLGFCHGIPTLLWLMTGALSVVRDARETFSRNDPPPGDTDEPESEPATPPDYREEWRTAAARFVAAGALYGFGVRDIGAGEHQVVGWDDWGLIRDYLIDAGVLSPKGGTRWGVGWNWDTWQRDYMTLPLPPVKVRPPEVLLTPNAQRRQQQQRPQQA